MSMRFRALALALVTVLPACGSGGGDPVVAITALARAAGCTVAGLEDYSAVVEAIRGEFEKAPVPSNLNVNVVVDGRSVALTGTITETAGDLSDGFDPGDAAEIAITSLSVDGVVMGSGLLVLSFQGATSLLGAGDLQLMDGSCSVQLNNIGLLTDPTADGYPMGRLEFTTNVASDSMTGQIEFVGGAIAEVTAQLNGGAPVMFSIDLDSLEAIFDS